jgi:hypothetical protein
MQESERVDTKIVMMNDREHMRDAVFFEGPEVRQRSSRFWILITLASIIAAAGVAADSTATVIGAMIVAPLMTPILVHIQDRFRAMSYGSEHETSYLRTYAF